MPVISPTPVASWRVQARRWRKNNQGRSPESLSPEERRASLRARAAFWCATATCPAEGPQPSGCTQCGLSTHSWCEACYSRCRADEPFSALCSVCDQAHFVCPACEELGLSWTDGHRAYEASHGPEDYTTIEVTVDPTQPPVRISIADLAASSGLTVEQLQEEIFREMGAPSA